jgi:PEP-CTERM motif
MTRKYAALVGAALGGIGFFFCGGGSRAEPINVTVEAVYLGIFAGNPQDFYNFSVTNNLSGGNRSYQFNAYFGDPIVLPIGEPTGFAVTDFPSASWTDDDYNSAIAPGETGGFGALNFVDGILPSIDWSVSVEDGPNGEATAFFYGTVETIPEPSTWAMMLLGFAGRGLAGYRRSRKAVSIAA